MTAIVPYFALAAGVLYTGTVSCATLIASAGRIEQLRRDARRVLVPLLRHPRSSSIRPSRFPVAPLQRPAEAFRTRRSRP